MPTEPLRMPNYGGQALIEGVLMRGKKISRCSIQNSGWEDRYPD